MAIKRTPNPGPAARHTPGIIAAAAQHDQPGRQVHQRGDDGAMGIVGKRKARQRVFFQRIGAALQHDRGGLQATRDGEDGFMQHPGHFTVIEAGGHGDICRMAPCPIANATRERPAPILMH